MFLNVIHDHNVTLFILYIFLDEIIAYCFHSFVLGSFLCKYIRIPLVMYQLDIEQSSGMGVLCMGP